MKSINTCTYNNTACLDKRSGVTRMQKQINDTMLMALQTAKSGGQENQETKSDEHFTKI